jgi:hypothetical protein
MVLFLVLGKFSEWPCPFSPPLKWAQIIRVTK